MWTVPARALHNGIRGNDVSLRRVVRGVAAVVVAGALGGLSGGLAAASTDDGSRPAPPAERSAAPTPAPREPWSSTYPSPPPPPAPEPEPAPPPAPPTPPLAPAVPAICLQRPNILCASKAEKTLRYFERGALWLATPVAFGRPGYETPSGLYAVRVKDANAWSKEYDTAMPYSLEYDLARGIYIHYSPTFAAAGPGYIGSHGCVNVGDLEAAKTLFNRVPLGAAVYVY